MSALRDLPVVALGRQYRKCAAEIPQERIALLRAADHHSSEGGKKGSRIVPSQAFELCDQVTGPVVRAYFDAVRQERFDAATSHEFRADRRQVRPEVGIDVR